jgi:hypothetical protein
MNHRYNKVLVDPYLDEKCFKDNLGENNYIFIGSSCDMFAKDIDERWIKRVLHYCCVYPHNTYLLQTKNPSNFLHDIFDFMPYDNFIYCTTIETNRENNLYNAPERKYREIAIMGINRNRRVMITIEPIMDFDLIEFRDMLYRMNPIQINIGADSGHNNLPEPSKEKVLQLIKELKKLKLKVFLKDNLQRLIK